LLLAGTSDFAAYLERYRSAVESYESTERRIIEQYKNILKNASGQCRDLLKKNAAVSGILGGLPISISEKIRGKFSLTKENEGTLVITNETDSAENSAIFDVRVVTLASGESGPAIVSAVNQTMFLKLKKPGFLGDIATGRVAGYLGIDGNQLSGYIVIDGWPQREIHLTLPSKI